MKPFTLSLLALLLSAKVFANSAQSPIDLSQYTYETVAITCASPGISIVDYSATEDLNLQGKKCPEAVSYIKNNAAYSVEYAHVTPWPDYRNRPSFTYFLVEYIKKKPEIDTLNKVEQQPIDLSKYQHESVIIACDERIKRILFYNSTEGLNLDGKNCVQAASYVKSLSAESLQYTKITPFAVSHSASVLFIEYLKKK